ncbi:MAG TPA: hypothetical protein VFK86_16930 [Bauldia sp.]|nr:hypothetical protein [Bauldia sp.]
MAIGVLFDFPGGTQEQYEAVCRDLNGGKTLSVLSEWPGPGIVAHIAGPTSDGWRVVDVWESEETFQDFGAKLVPLLRKHRLPEVAPQIFRAHNVVRA